MMLAITGDKKYLKMKDFIFEPKLDGFRAICIKKAGKLTFSSRIERNITKDYPEFNFEKNIKGNCILDGEIVIYDEEGNPSFPLMQKKHEHDIPATYVVFDILEKKGKNLRKLPLIERKKILQQIVKENKRIQIMFYTEKGEALWKQIVSRHLEGVIAKRKSSIYVDARSRDWIKIKHEKTLDCIILGYTKQKRSISSLGLGLYDKGKLIYIGKVGTGFNETIMQELIKELKDAKHSIIDMPKDVRAVIPKIVCEVRYLRFTEDKKLRASIFLGLRKDKLPQDCTMDQAKIYA